jgi:superfamily II DNA or RNA helicase
MQLHPHQTEFETAIYTAMQQHQNVMAVSECGSGKTVVLSHILKKSEVPSVVIAHRTELISQASLTLARNGVRHNIVAQQKIINTIIQAHVAKFGRSYYHSTAPVHVASVQTLINRNIHKMKIGLWIVDEAAHFINDSVWDRCIRAMPREAKGIGFTATPIRADGKGLGRDAHGLFDVIVLGKPARWLIEQGFLVDYRIVAPTTGIDLTHVPVGSSGDYVLQKLRESVHESTIVGDTVVNYLRFAFGKRTIVFTVDIESAMETAAAFRAAGIRAEGVSSKTDHHVRDQALRKIERGEIDVLCNMGLFGEGTDLPCVECVMFARPTESYPLYHQMFFRPMRTDPANAGKVALIIDQVGNVARHGLPDKPRIWTLDAAERRSRTNSDKPTTRTCLNPTCLCVYDRALYGRKCPYCGYEVEVEARIGPEAVDGDLSELSLEVLAIMRGNIETARAEPILPYAAHHNPAIKGAILKNHRKHIEALDVVQLAIATWAIGKDNIPAAQREFYLTFGIDVMSAQALPTKDALELIKRIEECKLMK